MPFDTNFDDAERGLRLELIQESLLCKVISSFFFGSKASREYLPMKS